MIVQSNFVVFVVRKASIPFEDGIRVMIEDRVSPKLIQFGLAITKFIQIEGVYCILWEFKNDPGAMRAKQALEVELMYLLKAIFPEDSTMEFLPWCRAMPEELSYDFTPDVPEKYD